VPTTTAPPPPPSGGNTKYIVLVLLILGAAAGAWFLATQSKPPPPPPPKPAEVARVNPMAQPDLELEQPKVEDAGVAKAPEEPEKRPVRKGGGVAAGEWDCSGDLPGAGRVVLDNSAQIRSCYERRLKMNNALQGDLRLKIKIGGNGHVVASQVTGSLHDSEVFSCVRNLAQTWTFGVPSGGNCAVISVPFQFSPKP
jgi:hypothetical protein